MTVYDIYDESIRSLPAGARLQLARLILDELSPDAPLEVEIPRQEGNVRDMEQLEKLLLAGVNSGPGIESTPEYWSRKHRLIDERQANAAASG